MKKQSGNLIILVLALLNVALWLIFPPPDVLKTSYALESAGEILASTAIILMAIAIVLSTKPTRLEAYFGGLDRMYQTHKQIAILAFLLLIAHFFVIPDSGELVAGKPLGMLAFAGIIILVLLSIAPRVPLISRFLSLSYSKWRGAHRLLGIFFILGLIHYLMVSTLSQQTVPGMYMMLFAVIGIIAYLYKELIAERIRPTLEYTVSEVRKLNGTCIEVTLKQDGKKLDFVAGQFLFIGFEGDRKMAERHPFTVSSSPREDDLRLSIRASGDWTRSLMQNLEVGTKAKVDGSYGMFNYKTGGKEQIWIAGGIGVTPFLSWVRDIDGSFDADVDFFYSVRSDAEALFWDEFQAAAAEYDTFRPHVRYSSVDGQLSPDQIAEISKGDVSGKDVYICGPYAMTEGFAKAFKKMGVPSGQIHYEEFNFR